MAFEFISHRLNIYFAYYGSGIIVMNKPKFIDEHAGYSNFAFDAIRKVLISELF